MFEKRGQVAMEFLMTYGWAILIILVAVAVLWMLGVFSPSAPTHCSVEAPFSCGDVVVGEGSLILRLSTTAKNAKVKNLVVNGVDCPSLVGVDLKKGVTSDVLCSGLSLEKGEKVTAEFDLNYKGPGGLAHSVTGTISGESKELAKSCKEVSGESGEYYIDPVSTGAIKVYCDMDIDSGGWTLIARTGNSCSNPNSFGWNNAIGSLDNLDECYSLGVGNTGLSFDEVMWGINSDNFNWGAHVYKRDFTDSDISTYSNSMSSSQTPIPVKGGNTANTMQRVFGFTSENDQFYMRDCCGVANFGMFPTMFKSTYCTDPKSGWLCNEKAMIFVR